MRFLITILVAVAVAITASAQTAQFPNINVRTNASVGTLTNTSGQAITTTGFTMPSTGVLGGTSGEPVESIANSIDAAGYVQDAVARLAFSPTYGLNNSYIWQGGYGLPGATTSTFSGWGQGVGTNTQPFSQFSFKVYPFDTNSVPTTLAIRLRNVQASWVPGGAIAGTTNPSTWTIITAQTNAYSLTALQTNTITVLLSSQIETSSNLWLEVLSNGKMGMIVANPVVNPDASIPAPAYQTTSSLTGTNWAAASSYSKEFTVEFGISNSLSGFAATTALYSALGLTNSAVFSLPSTNYATSGTEFNVYWRNVLRSSIPVEDLWLNATCTKGTQYADFFRTVPVDADAGTYSLTVTAGNITNTLATYSGQLKIAADSAGSGVTRKLLIIGDSTTDGGQVVTELNRISGTNGFKLDTIGTQGSGTNKHEGHSGWNINTFYTGAGGASPFTNGSGVFDFNFYLTNNSLTMASNDWVFVNLGINDVFSQTSDSGASTVAGTFLTTYSNMVVSIRAAVPGTRNGLCITIPPSYSQDAFGVNYPTGQTFDRYNRNRAILAEALKAHTQTGVYIVGIAAGLDTVNNMLTTTGVLNSRNTNAWTYLSNGVHPATSGYYQIADQMWAFLKCME